MGTEEPFSKEQFCTGAGGWPKPLVDFYRVKKKPHVKVDFFIRFESLQQDFHKACDHIGIPRRKLPHLNRASPQPYTHYYDDEMRELVAFKYAEDIEYFGYNFGKMPTKLGPSH